MQQAIERQLAELNAIRDTSYTFPQSPTHVPQVEWFQMEKRGNGWSCCQQAAEMRRVALPGEEDWRPNGASKQFNTLSKIKAYFAAFDNLFTCVVCEHLSAPSTIWQLVVWNLAQGEREALVAHLQQYGRNGETHDYHVDLQWVSDIPPETLATWRAY